MRERKLDAHSSETMDNRQMFEIPRNRPKQRSEVDASKNHIIIPDTVLTFFTNSIAMCKSILATAA